MTNFLNINKYLFIVFFILALFMSVQYSVYAVSVSDSRGISSDSIQNLNPQDVENYWTEERMREAKLIPINVVNSELPPDEQIIETGAPKSVGGKNPSEKYRDDELEDSVEGVEIEQDGFDDAVPYPMGRVMREENLQLDLGILVPYIISTTSKTNISPKKAIEVSETSRNESVKKIELKEELEKPVYIIESSRRAKLLFFIPISLNIETKVNAQTGDVVFVKKPWWSFLAF